MLIPRLEVVCFGVRFIIMVRLKRYKLENKLICIFTFTISTKFGGMFFRKGE